MVILERGFTLLAYIEICHSLQWVPYVLARPIFGEEIWYEGEFYIPLFSVYPCINIDTLSGTYRNHFILFKFYILYKHFFTLSGFYLSQISSPLQRRVSTISCLPLVDPTHTVEKVFEEPLGFTEGRKKRR